MPSATTTRSPFVSLKFIIVGGGISGLASAAALRKAGHEVLVLEKGSGKIKSKGGIQSPPNMTKLLIKWGLGSYLKERAHKCDKFIFNNGNTGQQIGSMMMGEEFLRDLVADFMFLQHKDLYNMLYQLAVKEGAQIRFNTCVTEVDSLAASVTTEYGETIFADVIVGADGYDSRTRQVVTESEDKPPNALDRHVIVTFTIPVHDLESDQDLKPLLNLSEWNIWLGEGYIMNANLLVGGKDLTATIIHSYNGPLRPEQEEWSENRTLEQCGIHLSNFAPAVQKILKRVSSVASRFYYLRDPPDDFVCSNSRIVLAGESAHPMLPGSNHGVSLIMEDAQTLGSLFSRIRSRDQISQLLTAYEEIRHPHCYETQTWDYHQRLQMKAPVGPQQDGRDELLRQTMAYGGWDHMDEASFRLVWGMELTLFAHDATEKVDDWWGQYGVLITRKHDRSSMEVKVLLGGTTVSADEVDDVTV